MRLLLSLFVGSALLGVALSDYSVAKPECRQVKEEVCSLRCLEQRCATRQVEECEQVPNKQCWDELEEHCDTKLVERCEEVPNRECRTEQEPHCTTELRTFPREKSERQCKVTWAQECNDLPHMEQGFKETPVTTKKCSTVTEEECSTYNEQVCTEEAVRDLPSSCPAPSARADCSSTTSICWAPGQRDVDCPGKDGHQHGLCCFNGCANVCLEAAAPRRVCRNVPRTACKQVPKTVCHDVTVIKKESVMNTVLKAVCVPVPKENCNQVVVTVEEQKAVETCVQKDVERCEVNYNTVCNNHPEQSCVKKPVTKCKTTYNKVCKSNPLTECSEVEVPAIVIKAASTCPAPRLSGCSRANSEANCWSPGLPDVDCAGPDGGHGLCCYNGCANVCLEPEERCETGRQTEQCKVVTREHCHSDHHADGSAHHTHSHDDHHTHDDHHGHAHTDHHPHDSANPHPHSDHHPTTRRFH